MTLRRKTLLALGLTLVGLVGALSLVARSFLLAGFAEVEEQDARQHVQQALGALSAELSNLDASVQDYAGWDAAYTFMVTRDRRFVAELPSAAKTSLHVHAVAMLDPQGEIVFGRGLDLDKKVNTALPPDLIEHLRPVPPLSDAEGGRSGVLMLEKGPMLVVSRPILTSEHQGQPRGTFVFGRYLDSWQIEQLTRYTALPLVVHRFDDPELSADLRSARATLSEQLLIVARPRDEHTIAGHALVNDLHGKPALILSVDVPRHVSAQGRVSLVYLTASLFLVGLTFAVVALLLVERFVLSRLRQLSSAVTRIGTDADLAARVSLPGGDELASLAASVNWMLEGLEASQLRLEESEARLRGIVEHSTNLFYSRGTDNVLTYVSPQVSAFLDCEPAEALGPWTDFVSDNPANAEGIASMQRALDTGERQPVYELELEGRAGRRTWVEVNEAPLVSAGKAVAVVGALTDITARKKAEAERAALEEQLRQSQKMEAVGTLAGGVAHDFNNILGVISGHVELLLRELGPGDPRMRRVEQIQKAAARAAALTRQLLAFSRKQVLVPEILEMGSVVGDLDPMLRRIIGEDIELVAVIQPNSLCFKADRSQLEQVILNLVVNARDAMLQGGKLTLKVIATDLDDAFSRANPGSRPGPYVLLEVSDTGVGMDAATRRHIFEPFYTTKEKGTGLGLAMVYGVMKQSGGYITVDSELGRGTTFRIYLPRLEGAAATAPLEGAARGRTRDWKGSETLLLVEDDEVLRCLVQEVLEKAGYRVLVAENGTEGLRTARDYAGHIHLMLTDVVMPGLSGREVADHLAAERPETRVLYMSGYTADALAQRDVVATHAALIDKPFTPVSLLRRLREMLAS